MQQNYRAQPHDKMHTQYIGQIEKMPEEIYRDVWGSDKGVPED